MISTINYVSNNICRSESSARKQRKEYANFSKQDGHDRLREKDYRHDANLVAGLEPPIRVYRSLWVRLSGKKMDAQLQNGTTTRYCKRRRKFGFLLRRFEECPGCENTYGNPHRSCRAERIMLAFSVQGTEDQEHAATAPII